MATRPRDRTAAPLNDEPERRGGSLVEGTAFGAWDPSDEWLDACGHQALAFVLDGLPISPRPWAAVIFWHVDRCEECTALFEAPENELRGLLVVPRHEEPS